MRSSKGSQRIVVHSTEYRWRATGNDGYITVGIWPSNNVGPFIYGNFKYHETWGDNGDGSLSSLGNQIVITNRIIRRIIELVIAKLNYDPNANGPQLNLRKLDDLIQWSDAVRASDIPN